MLHLRLIDSQRSPARTGCRLLAVALVMAINAWPGVVIAQIPEWSPSEEQTRALVLAAFKRLSDGRHVEHVEKNFAPDAKLVIHGPTELAGSFNGRAEIVKALGRLFRSVPHPQLSHPRKLGHDHIR